MAQDWTSFTLNIAVKADIQTIYNAWSQSDELEKWFLETCDFKNKNGEIFNKNQPATENCTYDWKWFLYDPTEIGTIVKANGKDNFQFTFAGECLVDINLEQIDDHTKITLTHSNIPTDETSKFNIRIGCDQGWTFFLTNLKSYYETGYDLRNKIHELKGLNG